MIMQFMVFLFRLQYLSKNEMCWIASDACTVHVRTVYVPTCNSLDVYVCVCECCMDGWMFFDSNSERDFDFNPIAISRVFYAVLHLCKESYRQKYAIAFRTKKEKKNNKEREEKIWTNEMWYNQRYSHAENLFEDLQQPYRFKEKLAH